MSLSTRMVVVPMPIVYIMHARRSTYPYRSPQSQAISNISECLPEVGHRRYAMTMRGFGEQVAGSLLQSARLRLGMSQTAFADLLGIAQPTLSAYESGRRQPTVPTLSRMLASAGMELRLELAYRDNHDAVLAGWERTLDAATKQRLRSQGHRLADDAA